LEELSPPRLFLEMLLFRISHNFLIFSLWAAVQFQDARPMDELRVGPSSGSQLRQTMEFTLPDLNFPTKDQPKNLGTDKRTYDEMVEVSSSTHVEQGKRALQLLKEDSIIL
jgi:hypothetical protein